METRISPSMDGMVLVHRRHGDRARRRQHEWLIIEKEIQQMQMMKYKAVYIDEAKPAFGALPAKKKFSCSTPQVGIQVCMENRPRALVSTNRSFLPNLDTSPYYSCPAWRSGKPVHDKYWEQHTLVR